MPNPGLGDAILHLLPLARKGSRRAPYGEKDASRLSKGYAYSDDRLIWLSFVHPPKDGRRFVFGADNTCDVRIVGKKISDRHFAIILCPSSGIPLLVNGSSFGTLVGSKFLSRKNESHVLEQNVTIACGDFRCMVITPDRGKYQKKYEENLLKYLRQLKVPAEDISIHATPIQSHRRVGQFLEIANLGCGGFGEVSLFADSKTGEVHAAKRFRDKNNFDAILKEMDTLKKLSHKHIVEFNGYIYDESSLCLLMEYLPYGNLENYDNLEIPVILEVLRQCLGALEYLHRHYVMHRDIKPNNISVQSLSPVNVKLIDFGLAREAPQANTFCGTVMYLPPEMVNGITYTDLVDVWALGLTAMELLTGLPGKEFERFHRDRRVENFEKYFNAIHRRRRTLPEPVSDLLGGMLEYDPSYRWPVKKCLSKVAAVQDSIRYRSR